MFYTYILKSKNDSSYYVGSCKDLVKRFVLHNKGLVKSTKRGTPWEIIYKESFLDFKIARKRELEIKSWKSRKAIENLLIEDPR